MSASVNKVILVGNLGGEPETHNFEGGGKSVKLSVATGKPWTDKETGEKRDNTQWHTVVILNKNLADFAEKNLHKGNKVYVEGALEHRAFQTTKGFKQTVSEVVLRPYNGDLQLFPNVPRQGETPKPTAADGPKTSG